MKFIYMIKKGYIQEMPSPIGFDHFPKRMFIQLNTGLEILEMSGCTRLLMGSVQLSQ